MLAACGGGGGGSNKSPLVPNPSEKMQLTMTADRSSLPLNLAAAPAAIGGPFTSTINLRSSFVPGGGPQGGNCWSAEFTIIAGAASGRLVAPPLAGLSNGDLSFFTATSSGNWQVLLNATDQAGVVTIEVAVPNPDTATVTCNDDKIEIGARFAGTPITYERKQIQVAVGQATGKASQILINSASPNFLFAQNTNGTTQLIVQAQVLDEAGQRVADPASGTHNLYASIIETAATVDNDALLRAGGSSGKWVLTNSTNGQAQFTIVSGVATGTLLVEFLADRFDNNVDNGITEPVRNVVAVPVVTAVGQEALAISTETELPGAVEDKSYATVLTATGGVPPYRWERVAGSVLPNGLSLSSDGIISGTPFDDGTFRFALRVTDSSTVPQSVVKEFSITVEPAPPTEPVVPPIQILTTGLPSGSVGTFYEALLFAVGGDPSSYRWGALTPLPPGLTISTSGEVSGTPTTVGATTVNFVVTDADNRTATKTLTITIN